MSHPDPTHDHENERTDDHPKSPRAKAIRDAIKGPIKRTMHLGKKGAPGITYKELTPKERHYRNDHQRRTDIRLNKFHNSGYGKHLSDRAKRRGEED